MSKPSPTSLVLDHRFSRNRNFDWYSSPEGEALRPFRRVVQGLVADLERVSPDQPVHFQIEPGTGQVWLELYIPRFRATRRCCLRTEEFEALLEHPLVGPRLSPRP